jgi:CRP-like cAMP-binding protein
VLVRDHTKKENFVREIQQGQMFGEVALLYKTKRTASVKSKNNLCTVGALNEDYFLELLQNFPELE